MEREERDYVYMLSRNLDKANARVEILAAALYEIADTNPQSQDLRWYAERAQRALVGAGMRAVEYDK